MSALGSALTEYGVVDPVDLPDPVVLDEIRELAAARDALDALLTRRVAVADRRDATVADRGLGTRSWLVAECRLAPTEAGRLVFLARRLAAHPLTAAAFAAGEIGREHARVVVSVLGRVPPEAVADAEAVLVELARAADPTAVARAGEALLLRFGADETGEEAAQRRYESRWLQVGGTFDSMVSISGMLDPETGEAVLAAVAAAATRRGEADERTPAQRRADALGEIARRALGSGALPDNGGEPPQVVVTVDWRWLHAALTCSVADTGAAARSEPVPAAPSAPELAMARTRIGPEAARRLACDAGILPAVLGGDGAVLDVGRTSRSWPAAIRRAARLRDGACTFPGCTAGLDACQLHHLVPWAEGGPTSLANSTHLCAFHHRLVHEGGWRMVRDSDGQPVAISPTGARHSAMPRAGPDQHGRSGG